ncbi:lipoprotein [Vibrio sp. SCSIO 43137]|uniref:lipoprotein n=1 Tax=Vibrio sp. SCSIO 43137 TaxID=3021011 RepID=UPI00230779C4|nr:lipoprotein [Vibrio sp. SCSIO 43137]WCE30840.1 lipoprotein [Vibrio sp. SCSIO 43137]
MKKLLFPLLLITLLSGCSIIALPFKAVGAVGDIISHNESAKQSEEMQTAALFASPEQQIDDEIQL